MKKEIRTIIASLFVFGLSSEGAVSVTASRTYVDSRTSLSPVTNNGQVVGFKLGIHTNGNEVLAAKSYVDNSTPGDYETVSNLAMNARSKTDMNAYSTNGVPTGDMLATTGDVEVAVGRIKTDRITDGTNTIDAAGNVWTTNVIPPWNINGEYFYWNDGKNQWTNGNYYIKLYGNYVTYGYVPFDYEEDIAGGLISHDGLSSDLYYLDGMGEGFFNRATRPYIPNKASRLALTNDIPPAVAVVAPSTNAVAGQAADAKATGTALYTGFTEWEFGGTAYDPSKSYELEVVPDGDYYIYYVYEGSDIVAFADTQTNPELLHLEFSTGNRLLVCDRHLVTPTKTSQLTNDGPPATDPNAGHPFATTNQIPAPVDISGKLDSAAVAADWSEAPPSIYQEGDVVMYNGSIWRHLSTSTNEDPPSLSNADWQPVFIYNWKQDRLTFDNSPTQDSDNPVKSGGVYAALQAKANASDVNTALAQKASLTDLPYAMVTPGEWEFNGSGYDPSKEYSVYETDYESEYVYNLTIDGEWVDDNSGLPQGALTVNFGSAHITATRASLPGHLLDRAVNYVPVTDATTITLPDIVTGKSRDFYLNMVVTGSRQVSFYPSSGITYTGYGNPSNTYAGGTYLLHFTETASNVFNVVNVLAATGSYNDLTDKPQIPVVSATDEAFSNAVLSVGLNIDTNTVAAINALVEQGEELPIGGATTVGALLLALAAAVAGLNNKKASKNVLTLVESGSAFELGQNVSVLGRNFPASAWQGKTIAISGVSEVSITYGGYASDCSVKLDGTPIGTPDSVQITQDSILEVSFATCLDPDTPILMADKSEKKLSDVKVGDIVSTPFGPDKVVEVSSGRGGRMDLWEFEDGTTIRTIGRHRFWNVDLGEFMYLEAWNIGERALKADGTETRLARHGLRFGDFGHATLFTEKGNVYYANGLVAGNRRSRTLRRSGT